jgi:hypothetical protein
MMVPAVCLVLATVGCSDDDGGNDDEKAGESTSDAPSKEEQKEARKRIAQTSDCTAEVSTTGAYEAEWQGEAQVRTGGKPADDPGPNAVFTLTDKKNRVALYSPGPEFKGSVSLSADGVAYSSDPADAESLDIDKHGKSASVDVTLTSTGGDTIDVVADFTCGKSKKQ